MFEEFHCLKFILLKLLRALRLCTVYWIFVLKLIVRAALFHRLQLTIKGATAEMNILMASAITSEVYSYYSTPIKQFVGSVIVPLIRMGDRKSFNFKIALPIKYSIEFFSISVCRTDFLTVNHLLFSSIARALKRVVNYDHNKMVYSSRFRFFFNTLVNLIHQCRRTM